MHHSKILTLATLLLLGGCTIFMGQKAEREPDLPAAAPADSTPTPAALPPKQLVITPAASPVMVEWGIRAETELQVAWATPRRQAVHIAPGPDTPSWLQVDLQPAVIEPPATARLRISTVPGSAVPGPLTLVLEATGTGLDQPERNELLLTLRRRGGEFHGLAGAPMSIECRHICGQVRNGALVFYDVRKEQGQRCDDAQEFPDSQRLGSRTYLLSPRGFAYGHTCEVAAVFDAAGALQFVNLGLSRALPPGSTLLTVRGALDAWLSLDNTVALVRIASALIPYDVITGRQLGSPCRIAGEFQPISLRGDTLTAGTCSWQIQ